MVEHTYTVSVEKSGIRWRLSTKPHVLRGEMSEQELTIQVLVELIEVDDRQLSLRFE